MMAARAPRSRRQQPVETSARGRCRRSAPPNGRSEAVGESRHHLLHRMGRTAPAKRGHPAGGIRSALVRAAERRRRAAVGRSPAVGTASRGSPGRRRALGRLGDHLERCLAAAKATADRSAEAWALHEIGTRALCVADSARARAHLGQAVKLREALQDDTAAAASRRNLRLVLAPLADESREPLDGASRVRAGCRFVTASRCCPARHSRRERPAPVCCRSRPCCLRSWDGSVIGLLRRASRDPRRREPCSRRSRTRCRHDRHGPRSRPLPGCTPTLSRPPAIRL